MIQAQGDTPDTETCIRTAFVSKIFHALCTFGFWKTLFHTPCLLWRHSNELDACREIFPY